MFDRLDSIASHRLVQDEGWTYLDVRTPGEFEAGHPEGSLNLPFSLIGPGGMMPNPEFLQLALRLFDKEAGLVLGCATGNRSLRACQMLAQVGYSRLVNVEGGYNGRKDATGQTTLKGWTDCSLPCAQGSDGGSYPAVRDKARG